MFSATLTTLLETASAKALATYGPAGINVVPVSMIKVTENSIWLFDFFMDKTARNTQADQACALTAWTDMKGVQIKAVVTYDTTGTYFDEAVSWVATQNPNRIVKGLLILKPVQIFDISPGGAFTADDLAI
jgi:predicted pyridoxine 5'-phosphate oxidase superfamily flavin-nucleotide-binding protein